MSLCALALSSVAYDAEPLAIAEYAKSLGRAEVQLANQTSRRSLVHVRRAPDNLPDFHQAKAIFATLVHVFVHALNYCLSSNILSITQ